MKRLAAFLLIAFLSVEAHTLEVATLSGSGWILAISKERGDCPEGTQRALYSSDKGMVAGCWFLAYETVWVVYADGDRGAYPQRMFAFKSI